MTTTIDFTLPQLPADLLPLLVLSSGGHNSRDEGCCVMEAAAWLAGEPHSAEPRCASPLITRIAQRLNDRFDQAMRDALRDRLPRIVGSRLSPAGEQARAIEFVYLLLTTRLAKA